MGLSRNKYSNLEGAPNAVGNAVNLDEFGNPILIENIPSYIHIKYSNDGLAFTANNGEEPGSWLGVNTDYNKKDSMVFSDYKWKRIDGKDGTPGTDGIPGKDGKSRYIHVAYADSADGTKSFNFTNGAFIGTVNNNFENPPQTPDSYAWSRKSGIATLTAFIFKRSANRPDVPAGGSFDDPNVYTHGWSDGVPEGSDPLYISRRTFTQDGEAPQEKVWSEPRIMSKETHGKDGSVTMFQFSKTNTTDDATWHYPAETDDQYMRTKFCQDGVCDTETWSTGTRFVGEHGDTYFKSTVFVMSPTKPNKPSGADFLHPVPQGWSDGIPTDMKKGDKLWMSVRTFTKSGKNQVDWSVPKLAITSPSDGIGADIEIQYSHSFVPVSVNPVNPRPSGAITNPDWSFAATGTDVWMRMRVVKDGTPVVYSGNSDGWEYTKIKGEKGEDATSTGLESSRDAIAKKMGFINYGDLVSQQGAGFFKKVGSTWVLNSNLVMTDDLMVGSINDPAKDNFYVKNNGDIKGANISGSKISAGTSIDSPIITGGTITGGTITGGTINAGILNAPSINGQLLVEGAKPFYYGGVRLSTEGYYCSDSGKTEISKIHMTLDGLHGRNNTNKRNITNSTMISFDTTPGLGANVFGPFSSYNEIYDNLALGVDLDKSGKSHINITTGTAYNFFIMVGTNTIVSTTSNVDSNKTLLFDAFGFRLAVAMGRTLSIINYEPLKTINFPGTGTVSFIIARANLTVGNCTDPNVVVQTKKISNKHVGHTIIQNF